MGGPSASVEELARLARRDPLKIYLKLPGMRGLKRKRHGDGVGDGGEREREAAGADGERVRVGAEAGPGIVTPVDEALREGVTTSTQVRRFDAMGGDVVER